MKKLEGKIAVITDDSKGIGASIAKHLAAEGAAVIVNYASSKEGADRVVDEIVSNGGKPICLFAAVCSEGATVTAKLQMADQLTEVSECVGQLKALKFETIVLTYDLKQVGEKYWQILTAFDV